MPKPSFFFALCQRFKALRSSRAELFCGTTTALAALSLLLIELLLTIIQTKAVVMDRQLNKFFLQSINPLRNRYYSIPLLGFILIKNSQSVSCFIRYRLISKILSVRGLASNSRLRPNEQRFIMEPNFEEDPDDFHSDGKMGLFAYFSALTITSTSMPYHHQLILK